MTGFHVVVEGGDGTGKSTVSKTIAEHLTKYGYSVEQHGNPGGTPLGQEIRALVKNRHDLVIDDYTIQVMMMADWCCYLNNVVKPAVAAGRVVVSDRANVISGICYGMAGGVSLDDIRNMQSIVPLNVPSMHVLLLHADFEVLQKRQHHDVAPNGTIKECRFQKKGVEFHKRVLNNYMKIIEIANISHGNPHDIYNKDELMHHLLRFVSVHWEQDGKRVEFADARGSIWPRMSLWPIDVTPDIEVVREEVIDAVDLILAEYLS